MEVDFAYCDPTEPHDCVVSKLDAQHPEASVSVTKSVTKTPRDGAAQMETAATTTACQARQMVTGETDQVV
jgi:hypothetical protein